MYNSNRIGFVLFMLCLSTLFTVFILLGDGGKVRSNRACFPVIWAGRLTTSTVELFDRDKANLLIRDNFKPAFSACVHSAADLFYGKNFIEHLKNFPDNFKR